jgi:hypothetical protein
MAYPQLKDQQLIEAYINSVKLKLDKEFILLLKAELERRGLKIPLTQSK